MGNSDGLTREAISQPEPTFISPGLRRKLIKIAMEEAFAFFEGFLGDSSREFEYDLLIDAYLEEFENAVELGLFGAGGIREKHHLGFWCLGRVFEPEIYIESGVFTGSSLHAYLRSPRLKEVVAIDPNLTHLKIPTEDMPSPALIDSMDFSQLQLDIVGLKVLTYFDDHINSASRVIQAAAQGLKFLVFDDSTGYEGLCQRLYPASPTIPMIMQADLYEVNDEVAWTFRGGNGQIVRSRWVATKEQIELCQQAKSLIEKVAKIPELEDHVPQLFPEKMPDAAKFIVKLK